MQKIVFLDLDDTLWRFEVIPSSALEAIHQARQNGHKIFTNTGRSKCEVPQLLWDLDLDGYCFSAGSEIYIQHKQVLYKPLEKQLVKKIQHLAIQKNTGYSLEGSDMTFTNDLNRKRMMEFSQQMTNNRIGNRFLDFPDVSKATEADYDQIMKVSIHMQTMQEKEEFIKALPEETVFTEFKHLGGEVTHKDYNKATAIEFVSNYFNHEYETMAMGDSENDITMLKAADIAVVMGNGIESVKQYGDYITDTIDNDGLYKAFKHFELI